MRSTRYNMSKPEASEVNQDPFIYNKIYVILHHDIKY